MRRPLLNVLLAALVVTTLAAVPPSDELVTTTAVLETDTCGDPLDGDVMADQHDLCAVTMTVVTAETPSVVPTVTMTLTAAAPNPGASDYLSTWFVGECAFQLRYDDQYEAVVTRIGDGETAVLYGCGAFEDRCTFTSTDPNLPDRVDCSRFYEDAGRVDVAPPVFDGADVVFSISFDGALARFAELHRPEQVITSFLHIAAPDNPAGTGGSVLAVRDCADRGVDGCEDLAGDVLHAPNSFTVLGPEEDGEG